MFHKTHSRYNYGRIKVWANEASTTGWTLSTSRFVLKLTHCHIPTRQCVITRGIICSRLLRPENYIPALICISLIEHSWALDIPRYCGSLNMTMQVNNDGLKLLETLSPNIKLNKCCGIFVPHRKLASLCGQHNIVHMHTCTPKVLQVLLSDIAPTTDGQKKSNTPPKSRNPVFTVKSGV
ncbi:hypothetical protein TNCV_3434441 [Trichonephila clavipes]|nr:hypothetical protein TNCV_3434441 [Trichonephila clavipes]